MCNPKLILVFLDPNHRVFKSESRLYEDPKINHRFTAATKITKKYELDRMQLYDLVKFVAEKMAKKLYKSDQLPGGKYWEPTATIQQTLSKMQPIYDVSESVLGLNDWLHKHNPNFMQRTASRL